VQNSDEKDRRKKNAKRQCDAKLNKQSCYDLATEDSHMTFFRRCRRGFLWLESLPDIKFVFHWSCDSHFIVGYAPRAPVGWRDLSDLTATSIWFATLPIALPDNCVFRRGVEVDWLARLLKATLIFSRRLCVPVCPCVGNFDGKYRGN